MSAARKTTPRPARRSLFPESITAGSPAIATTLRQRADRLDKRAQILADIEAIETRAKDRWNGKPTDHQARRLRTLAERYVEKTLACKTLRALADLHDRFDVPAPLMAVTTERHVATLTAHDPVRADFATPLGRALAWRTLSGTRRAPAVRVMAEHLERLDVRTGPLPLLVVRHLDSDPTEPEPPPTASASAAPVASGDEASGGEASGDAFEAWRERVEAVSAEGFEDGRGLVSRFSRIPWREGFDRSLSPEATADAVFAWIVARTVRGTCFSWPDPTETQPPPKEEGEQDEGRGEAPPAPPEAVPDIVLADRLDKQADRLAATVHKQRNLHDGERLTPRRARIRAAGQREADRLEPILSALRALAHAARTGATPPALAKVKTRATIEELVPSYAGDVPVWPHLDNDLGHRARRKRLIRADIRDADDFAEAVQALAALPIPADDRLPLDREAARIRTLTEGARLRGIPDYFFSPPAVCDALLDAAGFATDPGPDFHVLDPSAGDGAILDSLRARAPRATLHAVEVNHRLREILDAKGYSLVGRDALTFDRSEAYDLVVMNPPFGRGGALAMPHVRHAYGHVKPGGRLVAVVPESCFFRRYAAHRAFRDWIYASGGYDKSLPHRAFEPAGTSVAARFVVLDKPEP